MLKKLEPLKNKWNKLSLNKKSLLSAAIVSGVAVSAVSVYKFNQPDYVSAMSNLDRVSMQKIIPALESAKVVFKISPDGATLFVDKSQEDLASIILAKDGLPIAQTSGYSNLTNTKTPYLTRSAEQQLERQVLEENVEIAIKKIKDIQDVDVSLALSRNSAFLQDAKPSTASVVLTVKNGHSLTQSQVIGITNIVAHAVPNLDQKNVAIIDQTGRILSAYGDGSSDIPTRLSHKLEVEQVISQKITQVVAALVGLDNIRINVNADLNYDKTELTSDAPVMDSVVLSSQSDTNYDKSIGSAQGVAGALSNEPPKHATFDKKLKPQDTNDKEKGVSHKNVTTNYVVGKTITHTKKSFGGIDKLSIAILIDSRSFPVLKKESAAYKKRLISTVTALSEASVGFDSKRGDTISVEALKFNTTTTLKTKQPSAYTQIIDSIKNPSMSAISALFNYMCEGVLFMVLYLLFFKPIIKSINKKDDEDSSLSEDVVDGANGTLTNNNSNHQSTTSDMSPDEIARIHHQNLKEIALDHLENNTEAAKDVFSSWINNVDLGTATERQKNTDSDLNEVKVGENE